jgi:D-arginine dehydrogenase
VALNSDCCRTQKLDGNEITHEMSTMTFDYLVIGAGISGTAAAHDLSVSGTVLVIEAEASAGYHSTGRSAALFTRNYGGEIIRRINRLSHGFLAARPEGFCETPLLLPRGGLTVASPGAEDRLSTILALSVPGHEIERISADRAIDLMPLLRPERVGAAAYETGVMDIDVNALHQGYLRGIKRRGGTILCGARLDRLDHREGLWRARAGDASFDARIVVNAAGAWADHVGTMAGALPIGLVPRLRTAIIVETPEGLESSGMPAVDFIGTDAYLKPERGRIMASPGDQTTVEPQDAQPGEFDIAVLVDWLETETTLQIKRISSRWAGLRSFVDDGNPVVGFDPVVPNFFWLAGQGGYGIMMAPALGRATASLIVDGVLPDDLVASGLQTSDLSPLRLQ